jgi:guanylate kinase
VARDPGLWLSRSWTTRPRRPGEAHDAYTFVERKRFEEMIAADGFLEWAEFLGHLYGTPLPDAPPGRDVVLEIDLQGARQVKKRHPDALVVLLVPPSPEIQRERLRQRGDDPAEVDRRIAIGAEEMRLGRELTPFVVVNDEVDRAVSQVAGILDSYRNLPPDTPAGHRGGA